MPTNNIFLIKYISVAGKIPHVSLLIYIQNFQLKMKNITILHNIRLSFSMNDQISVIAVDKGVFVRIKGLLTNDMASEIEIDNHI